MAILECRNLKKVYGKEKTPAVEGIMLEIEEGSIFGFLGPNGAGKTTTIKMMTGLIRATEGEVTIGGSKVSPNGLQARNGLGYLSQDPRYYPWMTGKELLVFVAELYGMRRTDARGRAEELLSLSGLTEAADKRISAYSGGMVQRLGIAQALVNRPAILFLDEPVSALDPIGRKEVLEFISALKGNTTVFMSSHILADVERVCDRVGIINKGKMVVVEDTETLKRQYAPSQVELRFEAEVDGQRFVELARERGWQDLIIEQEGRFLIKPDRFSETRQELLTLIAENGLALAGMEVRSASLEDVFVKLIGTDSNDD